MSGLSEERRALAAEYALGLLDRRAWTTPRGWRRPTPPSPPRPRAGDATCPPSTARRRPPTCRRSSGRASRRSWAVSLASTSRADAGDLPRPRDVRAGQAAGLQRRGGRRRAPPALRLGLAEPGLLALRRARLGRRRPSRGHRPVDAAAAGARRAGADRHPPDRRQPPGGGCQRLRRRARGAGAAHGLHGARGPRARGLDAVGPAGRPALGRPAAGDAGGDAEPARLPARGGPAFRDHAGAGGRLPHRPADGPDPGEGAGRSCDGFSDASPFLSRKGDWGSLGASLARRRAMRSPLSLAGWRERVARPGSGARGRSLNSPASPRSRAIS